MPPDDDEISRQRETDEATVRLRDWVSDPDLVTAHARLSDPEAWAGLVGPTEDDPLPEEKAAEWITTAGAPPAIAFTALRHRVEVHAESTAAESVDRRLADFVSNDNGNELLTTLIALRSDGIDLTSLDAQDLLDASFTNWGLGGSTLPSSVCSTSTLTDGSTRIDYDFETDESLTTVSTSIQPLNWPRCNASFKSVDVESKSVSNLTSTVRKEGSRHEEFSVVYEELVLLPWPWGYMKQIRTRLRCTEWREFDPSGILTEVGMKYDLAPGGDGTVVVDSGFAIATALPGGRVQVKTRKDIRFSDTVDGGDAANKSTGFSCSYWGPAFHLTMSSCKGRKELGRSDVKAREKATKVAPSGPKKRSKAAAPGDDPTGTPLPDGGTGWLSPWIDDAGAFGQRFATGQAIESARLLERWSSIDGAAPETSFYDLLEVWETNLPLFRDGLDLLVRFMSGTTRAVDNTLRPTTGTDAESSTP